MRSSQMSTYEFQICNKFFKYLYVLNQRWFEVRNPFSGQEDIIECVRKLEPAINELGTLLYKNAKSLRENSTNQDPE